MAFRSPGGTGWSRTTWSSSSAPCLHPAPVPHRLACRPRVPRNSLCCVLAQRALSGQRSAARRRFRRPGKPRILFPFPSNGGYMGLGRRRGAALRHRLRARTSAVSQPRTHGASLLPAGRRFGDRAANDVGRCASGLHHDAISGTARLTRSSSSLKTTPSMSKAGTIIIALERAGISDFYRSASASFTPSATNAAAKVRRIQVSTRGREMTWLRIAAANRP